MRHYHRRRQRSSTFSPARKSQRTTLSAVAVSAPANRSSACAKHMTGTDDDRSAVLHNPIFAFSADHFVSFNERLQCVRDRRFGGFVASDVQELKYLTAA